MYGLLETRGSPEEYPYVYSSTALRCASSISFSVTPPPLSLSPKNQLCTFRLFRAFAQTDVVSSAPKGRGAAEETQKRKWLVHHRKSLGATAEFQVREVGWKWVETSVEEGAETTGMVGMGSSSRRTNGILTVW